MTVPPSFRKVNPADQPIINFSLVSSTLPLSTVDDYGEITLAQQISQLPGIAQVQVNGAQKFAVRVQVDPVAAASRGISLEDVRTMLAKTNSNTPVGTIAGVKQNTILTATAAMRTAAEYRDVIGIGMNAAELAANPRLSRRSVQNLNRDTALPLADSSLDAAMICVSIQYLQQPVAVLREVARALRPGAPLVISFSNRCFWTKAVAVWRGLDDAGHARLVELYLNSADFERIETRRLAPWIEDEQDPMIAVIGRKPE